MAQSININQRIVIVGGDDARRQLQQVAQAGSEMGQQIQRSIQTVNQPIQTFNDNLERTEVSARATRYAVQNLTFQINDVVTSLASGISPFRTFTQQGGQFVQLFQQGGGIGNVLGTFARGVTAWLTPTRLAIGGLAGVTAGIGFLLNRIRESEDRIKGFGNVLAGIGLGGPVESRLPTVLSGQGPGSRINIPSEGVGAEKVTDKSVETIIKDLRILGLTADETAQKVGAAIRTIVNVPNFGNTVSNIERMIVTGEKLNQVFQDTGGFQRVLAALQGGVPGVQDLARQLAIPEAQVQGITNVAQGFALIETRLKDVVIIVDPLNQQWVRLKANIENAEDALAKFVKEGLVNTKQVGIAFGDAFSAVANTLARPGGGARVGSVLADAIASEIGIALQSSLVVHVGKPINDFFANLFSGKTIKFDFSGVYADIGELENAFKGLANRIIGYFQPVADAISKALHGDIGALFRSEPAVPANAVNTSQVDTGQYYQAPATGGFARGGLAIGPGSGTSDSMWARISNGEYIVNAAATRANLPILEAINSIGRPMRSRKGFAAGGLMAGIGAVDARTRFTLVIEGQQYADITAPAAIADKLLVHARTSSMLSTGTMPGWKGSR